MVLQSSSGYFSNVCLVDIDGLAKDARHVVAVASRHLPRTYDVEGARVHRVDIKSSDAELVWGLGFLLRLGPRRPLASTIRGLVGTIRGLVGTIRVGGLSVARLGGVAARSTFRDAKGLLGPRPGVLTSYIVEKLLRLNI